MINVTFDDRALVAALRDLQRAATNLRPALKEIGEALTESTKARFAAYTGPDGVMWEANSDVTYERKAERSGIPLTDGGTLGNTIDWDLLGNDGVKIYSPMGYAAMQQFGGTKAEFPQLWGDIPARPFLGISTEDEADVLAIIRRHLESAL
jgi:phage virion morphogenesis protein